MKKCILIACLILTGCAFQPIVATELMGKDKDYVLNRFGEPTIVRTETPNQIWSYRDENCSYLVFFDENNVVRWVDAQGSCENTPASEKPTNK